jgi:hypothetical protein
VKNNLEDIFKVLKDYSEEAPDLMAAIQAKRSKSAGGFVNHLRRNVVKYAAAVLVLISLSIFFLTENHENGTVEAEQGSKNRNQILNDQTALNPNKKSPQMKYSETEDGTDKNTKPTQIEPTTIESSSTINQTDPKPIVANRTPVNEQKADPGTTKQGQPIVRHENAPKNERIVEIEETPTPPKPELPVREPEAVIEDQGQDKQKNEAPKTEIIVEEQKEEISDEDVQDKPIVEADPVENEKEQQIKNDGPSVDKNSPIKDIPNEKPLLRKWSIEALGGWGIAGDGIISNSEASAIRNNSEKHVGSIQASLLVNYEINNYFELQTGMNYNTSNTEVNFTNKYDKTVRDITFQDVIIHDFPGGPGREVRLFDTSYSTQQITDEYRNSNSIKSFQIPLSLKLKFQLKKLTLYFKPGINIEVATVTDGKVLSENLEWRTLNSDAYVRKNYLRSYQLGLGANYLIGNRVAFILEANSQRTFDTVWNNSNAVDEIQINNSIKTGFKFYF